MQGIRQLGTRDVSAYRALMLAGFECSPDAFTSSVAERRRWSRARWKAALTPRTLSSVFGAFASNHLVGVLGLQCNARDKTRHRAMVFGLYVSEEHRGNGHGHRLVEAVVASARENPGLRILQLTVTEHNTVAEALYRAAGFRRFGVEPLAICAGGNRYLAKVHMYLDLYPGRPGEPVTRV